MEMEFEMKINKRKSAFFLINQQAALEEDTINGYSIASEYKHLGIVLDKFGSLKPHLNILDKRIKYLQVKVGWICR